MMCSHNQFYICIGNSPFYLFDMRTLRVIIHLHAGTEMNDIHSMLQEGFYQPVNPAPGTSAARKECYHLDILAVIAEMHRTPVESLETAHARTCL